MANHGLLPFKVTHARLRPKRHVFTYKFFWFKLDLNKLDNLPASFIGYNNRNLYSFHDRDHLKLGKQTAKENYIEFARQNGVTATIKDVVIYTQLRCFGYVFNPVSFIFLKDETEKDYCIIEIGNTFNELKPYFVGNEYFQNGNFTFTTKKLFYISPFVDHDNEMTFQFSSNGVEKFIRIDDFRGNENVLTVTFDGKEKEMTNLELILLSLRSPLVTFQFIFFIHLHALILWLKGIPYFKKHEHPELQQGAQTWKV